VGDKRQRGCGLCSTPEGRRKISRGKLAGGCRGKFLVATPKTTLKRKERELRKPAVRFLRVREAIRCEGGKKRVGQTTTGGKNHFLKSSEQKIGVDGPFQDRTCRLDKQRRGVLSRKKT